MINDKQSLTDNVTITLNKVDKPMTKKYDPETPKGYCGTCSRIPCKCDKLRKRYAYMERRKKDELRNGVPWDEPYERRKG